MSVRYHIDVVLPAHNEGSHICVSLKRIQNVLETLPLYYRLIVVDDGSTDDTFEKVTGLQDERIVGIRLSRNFGKDAALKAGIDASSGDAVITMDSDLQHPPELIPLLLEAWVDSKVDIVHAVKKSRGQESRLKKMMVRCYFMLATYLAEVDLRNQSDFKLLDRRVVNVIRNLSESNFYFRGLTSWIGFKNSFVPFDVEQRTAGHSSWSFLDLARLSVRSIIAFSSAPMKLILLLGGLYFASSALVLAKMLYDFFLAGERAAGIPTIIALVLGVGGTCIFSIGLVGVYVANIYKEVKKRPLYLLRDSALTGNQASHTPFLTSQSPNRYFAASGNDRKAISIDELERRN